MSNTRTEKVCFFSALIAAVFSLSSAFASGPVCPFGPYLGPWWEYYTQPYRGHSGAADGIDPDGGDPFGILSGHLCQSPNPINSSTTGQGGAPSPANGHPGPTPERQVGEKGKSDPINIATGDYQLIQTDLELTGRGFGFSLSRMYRSRSGRTFLGSSDPSGENEPLGADWDFSYDLRVSTSDTFGNAPTTGAGGYSQYSAPYSDPGCQADVIPRLTLYAGNGRGIAFSNTDAHTYVNAEIRGYFIFSSCGMTPTYYTADGSVYSFSRILSGDKYAYIQKIVDKNNNQMTFSWVNIPGNNDGYKRLERVTDTLGREFLFTYMDDASAPALDAAASPAARLWKVTDPFGRSVEYSYQFTDGVLLLASVRMPQVKADAEFELPQQHARFPNGVSWHFQYGRHPTQTSFNPFQLTQVTNPNGDVILRNEYETELGDNSQPTAQTYFAGALVDRRVSRQWVGDSRVYSYKVTTSTGEDASWLSDTSDYIVWVTDPEGNVTRFDYQGLHDVLGVQVGRSLVRRIDYVGRSTPGTAAWATLNGPFGAPTTWTNGPTAPVRGSSSSAARVFQYDNNQSTLGLKQVTLPNGNIQQFSYGHESVNPPSDPLRAMAVTGISLLSGDHQHTVQVKWEYPFGAENGGTPSLDPGLIDGDCEAPTIIRYDEHKNPKLIFRGLPSTVQLSDPDAALMAEATSVDQYIYDQYGQLLVHEQPGFKLGIFPSTEPGPDYKRLDQFIYGTSGKDRGRITQVHIDSSGVSLVYTFHYDSLGHVKQMVGPNGRVSNFVYNQASQLVRTQVWDADPATVTAHLMSAADMYYDAAGYLVRIEEANLDADHNPVQSNPTITTVIGRDSIGQIEEVAKEAGAFTGSLQEFADGSGRYVVPRGSAWSNTKYFYTPNQKIASVVLPEGVDGRQASNRIDINYDEFGRPFQELLGQVLTLQYDYDSADRQTAKTVNPGNPAQARTTHQEFDFANRLTSVTDPMGNETTLEWSSLNTVDSVRVVGQLSDTDSTNSGAVLLAYSEFQYDPLHRRTATRTGLFVPGSLQPTQAPSQFETTTVEYNSNSSVRSITRPLGTYPGVPSTSVQRIFYDSVGRLLQVADQAGNTTEYVYNQDGDVSETKTTEVDGTTAPGKVYRKQFGYDKLKRVVSITEGSQSSGPNNITQLFYDSRGNVLKRINPRGNVTEAEYDSLGRLTKTIRHMTADGTGSSSPDSNNPEIVETREYDDDSRLIALTDDNGHRTTFAYDGLGRQISTTMPDNSVGSMEWNATGDLYRVVDARGIVVTNSFDLNGRLSSRAIGLPQNVPGVGGVTSEAFTYDGLGRVRLAINDATKTGRAYSSRSQVIAEIQNDDAAGGFPSAADRVTSYAYDVAGQLTNMIYPSGRNVWSSFDQVGRLSGLYQDQQLQQLIAGYTYSGPSRLSRRTLDNHVQTNYLYDGYDGAASASHVLAGDKGFGNISQIEHLLVPTGGGAPTTIDLRGMSWDSSGNKAALVDKRSSFVDRRERGFSYDSSNRLIASKNVYPNALSSFPGGDTSYQLDGVDNRISTDSTLDVDDNQTDLSGAQIGPYAMYANDAKNNQYTTSPAKFFSYDAAGNMLIRADLQGGDFNNDYQVTTQDTFDFLAAWFAQDPRADVDHNGIISVQDVFTFLGMWFENGAGHQRKHDHFTYDYKNRLIQVDRRTGSTQLLRATFTYDCFDRRVVTKFETDTNNDGVLDLAQTTQQIYGGAALWQLIEERDGVTAAAAVLETHVYGLGIDDLVQTRRGPPSSQQTYFFLADEQGSIYAATDFTGAVIERYDYGDFGSVKILAPDGVTVRSTSTIGNRHLYTGRIWLAEIGLYEYRHRFYDPSLGRFISRDPAGYAFGLCLYAYLNGNPTALIDPMGLGPNRPDRDAVIFLGGLKAIAGFGLASASFTFATVFSETFIAIPIGAAGMALGADLMQSGVQEFVNGDPAPTAMSEILIASGRTPTEAAAIETTTVITIATVVTGPATGAALGAVESSIGADAAGGARVAGAASEANASASSVASVATATADEVAAECAASAPVGRSGNPMVVVPGTNSPTTINGIDYSGHALDQMQGRGLVPSVVENTINHGSIFTSKPGTTGYYEPVNNVRVIVNSQTGRVVTVIPGKP